MGGRNKKARQTISSQFSVCIFLGWFSFLPSMICRKAAKLQSQYLFFVPAVSLQASRDCRPPVAFFSVCLHLILCFCNSRKEVRIKQSRAFTVSFKAGIARGITCSILNQHAPAEAAQCAVLCGGGAQSAAKNEDRASPIELAPCYFMYGSFTTSSVARMLTLRPSKHGTTEAC